MFAVPSEFLVIRKRVKNVAGRAAARATAYPVPLESTWLEGTGVNARLPAASCRPARTVRPNDAGAGHVVPDGGLVTAMRSERSKLSPTKTLTPISQKFVVSPSFRKSGKALP